MTRQILLLFSCLLFVAGLTAQPGVFMVSEDRYLDPAEYANFLPTEYDLYNLDKPLKIQLVSDFRNLVRKKFNREYQEAFLNVMIGEDIEIRHKIRIKPRGKNRLERCTNPPIMLNFKKGEFPMENLKDLDKIKLVNECSEGGKYESYLLKEYLAYKFYNELTPRSFRVCFVEIEFVDTGRNNKSRTSYGFLIEEGKVMAARNDVLYLGEKGILPENTEPYHAIEMAVFQYMIGNTDWSIKEKHNIKVLATKDQEAELYAVPYDFDYAGLVNASYAVPPEFLGITKVTERVFRSYCSPEEEFNEVFARFQELRPRFNQIVTEFTYLSEPEQKKVIKYLDSFYKVIENPKTVKNTIMADCRPRQ